MSRRAGRPTARRSPPVSAARCRRPDPLPVLLRKYAVPMLDTIRILDRTSGIAGPYCTKVLADAGADVVKVEQSDGDPLRRRGSGALFEYLNASKRSVLLAGDDLEAAADVLVVD